MPWHAAESAERPRLGVGLAPSGVARRMRGAGLPERDGALVRNVEDGSPAAERGDALGRPHRDGRRPR
ncbi:MAG: hypothetical protein U0869_02125 [Chloroflexota bacterium]